MNKYYNNDNLENLHLSNPKNFRKKCYKSHVKNMLPIELSWYTDSVTLSISMMSLLQSYSTLTIVVLLMECDHFL